MEAQDEGTSQISNVLFHKSFPVDVRHNSKIFRRETGSMGSRQDLNASFPVPYQLDLSEEDRIVVTGGAAS